VGFLQQPASRRAFDLEVLVKEPFVLLAPKNHPLAKNREVTLRQLAEESFIFYRGRARDAALEACRRAGYEPRLLCESGELETVRSLVAAGVGIAILPAMTAQHTSKSLITLPLREPSLHRQLAAIWKKGTQPAAAAEAFMQMLRK
jgi:LysR family transcriptional regulator, hydrogen peroxide-inducible genes activator